MGKHEKKDPKDKKGKAMKRNPSNGHSDQEAPRRMSSEIMTPMTVT